MTEFRPLPVDQIERLNEQRQFVRDLVAKHFPALSIEGTAADLSVLQKVIDKAVLQPDQRWELQCLGIAYGDALIQRIPGLAWTEVTDEYGTDPTLRYQATSLRLNALTMISKRVEERRLVDLDAMASHFAELIPAEAREYS